jgi:hypothetical protein
MDNTSEALKKAIGKVGVKEVAHHLGMSPQTIYKWLEEKEVSGARNPLDRIKTIIEITNDMSIIDWLCQNFKGSFVPDKPSNEVFQLQDYLQYHAEISNRLSELNSSVLGAIIGDQRIDREEYDEIREQWYQVKQYIESFVQACKKWSDEYEKEVNSK